MTTPAICLAPASAARPLQGAGAGTPTQEAANVGITNRIEKPTPARPPKSRCRPTSGSPKRPSSARHHAMRALGPETADVRLTRDVEIQTRRRDTTRANAALRASSRFGRAHFTLQRLFTASKIPRATEGAAVLAHDVGGGYTHNPNGIDARAPAWRLRSAVPARCRRYGRGLPRPRYESRPRRRAEGASRHLRARSRAPRAVQARSAGSRGTQSSSHCVHLRARGITGRACAGPRAGRRVRPCRTVSSRARFRSTKRGRSPGKSRKRSKRPTITGSFTAT